MVINASDVTMMSTSKTEHARPGYLLAGVARACAMAWARRGIASASSHRKLDQKTEDLTVEPMESPTSTGVGRRGREPVRGGR